MIIILVQKKTLIRSTVLKNNYFMAKATINNKHNKEGTIWKSYHKETLSQTAMAYQLVSITPWKKDKGICTGHKR